MTEQEITFWKHVEKKSNGCWEWTASRTRDGYGKVKSKQKVYATHRLAYIFTHGSIPDGLCVLHKCDNPVCVNPEHLFLGTHSDNMQDCVRKGRQGKRSPGPIKLSFDTAEEIRTLFTRGISKHELSRRFDTTCRNVRAVINYECWKSPPPPPHVLDGSKAHNTLRTQG